MRDCSDLIVNGAKWNFFKAIEEFAVTPMWATRTARSTTLFPFRKLGAVPLTEKRLTKWRGEINMSVPFWSFGFLGFLMKITRRQETFIYNLLDLYRELDGPIHYSVLAERVGVSPFTAYDMLRLLEEKGLAASEYRVDSDKPVPGRSEVFFWPTEQAHNLWKVLAGETDTGDWETVKSRVLNRIRDGELQDRELAEQMLARVPPEGSSILRYCVEIITILALRLKRGAGRELLAEYLQKVLSEQNGASRVNLSLLSGFALGVLANENMDTAAWSSQMLDHVQRYQSLILEMDDKLMKRLIKNLAEVFSPLAQTE